MTDAWTFSTPLDAGRSLTLSQTAVRNTADRAVVVEAVRPLAATGTARYLGAVLLTAPHIGFGEYLAKRFPSPYFAKWGHRLPFTLRKKGETAALVLGFALRGSGQSSFAGIAVDYSESGHEYTATVPLGGRLCIPAKAWYGRCHPVPFEEIPEPKVTSR